MSPHHDDPGGRGSAADDVGLSTGAVARRLGVSATTLRSWERRYGIGPAEREHGRHRRWLPADITRLELMCSLTAQGIAPAEAARAALRRSSAGLQQRAAPAPVGSGVRPRTPGGRDALPLGAVRQECRGLARAAVRLDAPAVGELLEHALDTYGSVVAWEEIIAPALHAVGRKWASSGERYVEVEHLLSWHVSSALRSGRQSGETAGTAPVLLACVPGEQHSLPLEALDAALREAGVPRRMFGPALPVDALLEAVRRVGPSAVVLWAQARPAGVDLGRVVDAVAGVAWGVKGARSHPQVLVGGPGWAGVPEAGSRLLTGLGSGLDVICGIVGLPRAVGLSRAVSPPPAASTTPGMR
ncbi:MerR family transcriptional regulator [Streptomyces sp. NPDC048349]|uniref:MerR family transcriptional regulator n=1 Tax=Streptomyces sp. NPDC048349 TaxID=3155486 RepID=UPI0034217EBA